RITVACRLPADQEHDDQDRRPDANHGPVLHAALGRVARHGRRRIVGHHHQADSAAAGGGAPTLSANLPKNWSASFRAVPWINRAPTCAILPPTWASTSYASTVAPVSSVSFTTAPPLAKPATPPCPSPEIL